MIENVFILYEFLVEGIDDDALIPRSIRLILETTEQLERNNWTNKVYFSAIEYLQDKKIDHLEGEHGAKIREREQEKSVEVSHYK